MRVRAGWTDCGERRSIAVRSTCWVACRIRRKCSPVKGRWRVARSAVTADRYAPARAIRRGGSRKNDPLNQHQQLYFDLLVAVDVDTPEVVEPFFDRAEPEQQGRLLTEMMGTLAGLMQVQVDDSGESPQQIAARWRTGFIDAILPQLGESAAAWEVCAGAVIDSIPAYLAQIDEIPAPLADAFTKVEDVSELLLAAAHLVAGMVQVHGFSERERHGFFRKFAREV
jgi:hypothetical protein